MVNRRIVKREMSYLVARLEQRFTKNEIKQMMESSGLKNITFSEESPFWCAVGYA